MQEKTERLNLVLTHEEMLKLTALAGANTGNNKSLMVRELINLAYMRPSGLGLHPPAQRKAKANE